MSSQLYNFGYEMYILYYLNHHLYIFSMHNLIETGFISETEVWMNMCFMSPFHVFNDLYSTIFYKKV